MNLIYLFDFFVSLGCPLIYISTFLNFPIFNKSITCFTTSIWKLLGHICAVDISIGSIPASLGNLTQLTGLNIQFNKLMGMKYFFPYLFWQLIFNFFELFPLHFFYYYSIYRNCSITFRLSLSLGCPQSYVSTLPFFAFPSLISCITFSLLAIDICIWFTIVNYFYSIYFKMGVGYLSFKYFVLNIIAGWCPFR